MPTLCLNRTLCSVTKELLGLCHPPVLVEILICITLMPECLLSNVLTIYNSIIMRKDIPHIFMSYWVNYVTEFWSSLFGGLFFDKKWPLVNIYLCFSVICVLNRLWRHYDEPSFGWNDVCLCVFMQSYLKCCGAWWWEFRLRLIWATSQACLYSLSLCHFPFWQLLYSS